MSDRLTNKVTIVSPEPRAVPKSEEIVRSAVYQQKGGFFNGELYIGACVGGGALRLIGLWNGNFWNNSDRVPENFVRVPPGSNINIEVGE